MQSCPIADADAVRCSSGQKLARMMENPPNAQVKMVVASGLPKELRRPVHSPWHQQCTEHRPDAQGACGPAQDPWIGRWSFNCMATSGSCACLAAAALAPGVAVATAAPAVAFWAALGHDGVGQLSAKAGQSEHKQSANKTSRRVP